MGLTYGVAKHPDGTPAKNTTLNFWCGGVKTSDVTDASGNYALFLTGPAQYVVQVGGAPCAESPIPVLAGTLLCNLTTRTKDEPPACACACACGCADERTGDHKLFFYRATKTTSVKPVKKLPALWGYQYQANPAGDGGTYECNNRKDQTDNDGSDVIDTILVLQAPVPDAPAPPPTQADADKYVRNWMQPFDPGA